MSHKETALITGASLGLGLEFARLFAKRGTDLVLVARNEGRLKEVAADLSREHGVKTTVIALDLSDPRSPEHLEKSLKERAIHIDYLVNNAGFGVCGPFADTPLDQELQMIQLHISALTELCKRFLRPMKAKGFGRILNVASTAAFQPGPLMAVYYASKAYVVSFSEALSNELNGTGVSVTAFCPGPTQTEFQKSAHMERIRIAHFYLMTAERAAKVGFQGMLRGRMMVIPGVRNLGLAAVSKMMPGRITAAVARKLQEELRG